MRSLVLLSVCGSAACMFGRSYAAEDRRLIRRVDPIAAPVQADGFYSAATCATACPVWAPERVERCYPVKFEVPVSPERIVLCDYDNDYVERRTAVPRASLESAHVGSTRRSGSWNLPVDNASCARFCAKQGMRVNSCDVEADLPPTPPGDFVICVKHTPAGSDLIIR
jgi:hypothetical protein